VLSAIAHGHDVNIDKSVQIAFAAQFASLGLDVDRSKMYFDFIMASLSEAARGKFENMQPANYVYQSDFAKRYVAQGEALGEAKGRADLVLRQLTLRFGPPGDAVQRQIAQASISELNDIGERLLTASTIQEAIERGSPEQPG